MLLQPPSRDRPASIVGIRLSSSHAARKVVDFVRASGIFRDVAGENEETFVNWDTGRETRRIFAVAVTKNYFAALGVPVALGRGIVPQDPDEVVVLRHEFWRTHFNGDPGVIGRTMRLEGRPYSVIGVLPPAQRTLVGLGFSPDVYVPSYLRTRHSRCHGRLEPGTSLGEARARMQTIASRLDSVSPREYRYADAVQVSPVAGIARVRGKLLPVALFFVVLLTIVALVLLVACVNVAGLLLARASARRQEMAIRLAIGASRGRLVQQLLVESLLLASLGAAFGLVLARLAGDAAGRIQLPLPVPLRLHMDIDWRVAAYAAAITVLAACATGLLPAWQTVQEAIAPDLQRHRRVWVRKTLIIGQVAVSVVIVATAGLFVRNLVAANEISPGFDVVHTLRAEVNLPAAAYRSPEAIAAYVDRMLPALTSVPGITQAAAARIVPFTDGITNTNTLTFTNEPGEVHARFHWNAVTPAYFDVLAIPFLQGRAFAEGDRAGERVVIVNRAFVARYRSGRSPIGSVFRWGGDTRTAPDRGSCREHEEHDGRRRRRTADLPAARADRDGSPAAAVRAARGHTTSAASGTRAARAPAERTVGRNRSRDPLFEYRPGVPAQPAGRRGPRVARRACARAHRDRAVRDDGLHGRAADSGDWGTDGAGRNEAGRSAPGSARGDRPRRRGSDHRHGVRADRHATAGDVFGLGSRRERSDHLRARARGADPHRCRGVVGPRSPGGTS